MTKENVLKLNEKAQELMDDLTYNYTDMDREQREDARQTIADYCKQQEEWRKDRMNDFMDDITEREDELTLYVMCGLPGSGKSTWAEKIAKITGAEIVSSDQIRKELYGSEEIQGNPKEVFEEFDRRIRDALDRGKSVIADSTAMTRRDRASILSAGENADRTVCCVMDTPVEECKRRNANRKRVVPDYVYGKMQKKYEPPAVDEGFDGIIVYSETWQREREPRDLAVDSRIAAEAEKERQRAERAAKEKEEMERMREETWDIHPENTAKKYEEKQKKEREEKEQEERSQKASKDRGHTRPDDDFIRDEIDEMIEMNGGTTKPVPEQKTREELLSKEAWYTELAERGSEGAADIMEDAYKIDMGTAGFEDKPEKTEMGLIERERFGSPSRTREKEPAWER